MHYLIYISSATKLLDEKELDGILKSSRQNNLKDDITGMLIYIDGNFIQLLEGEEKTVNHAYSKIKKDHRHTGIIKIKEGPAENRLFPEWSMGFKSMSVEEYGDVSGFKNIKEAAFRKNFDDSSEHPALIVLKSFMKNNRI